MPEAIVNAPQVLLAPILGSCSDLPAVQEKIRKRSFFLLKQLLDSEVLLKDHRYERSVPFQQIAQFSNRLGLLLAQNIIEAASIEQRAERIELTIELATELIKEGDFNGGFAVYQALIQSSVARLKESFAYALQNSESAKRFTKLETLFNPKNNWKALRDKVKSHVGRVFHQPTTLPLAPFSRDLCFKWDQLKTLNLTQEQKGKQIQALIAPYFHLKGVKAEPCPPLFDAHVVMDAKELYTLSATKEPPS